MKQNIIVLEDDADISSLVGYQLQNAGFTVHLCPSGNNVISLARQHPPTMFLLDVMVPGNSGFEVCRQVRESRDLAKVPVIFLTATSAASRLT